MARTLAAQKHILRPRIASNGNRPLRAVIFDMDGVIVDSHPAHRKAWRQFLQSMGREVSDQELDFILDGRKRIEILKHFLGDLSQTELDAQGKRKDEFFQDLAFEVKPISGVIEFINDLQERKIAIALATSASEIRARSTLERLRLLKLFQAIITGEDVRKGKPDPAIYRIACDRLNVEPSTVLAIEDAVSGVRAAKGAGIKCVGVASKHLSRELIAAGAECVVENFDPASQAKLRTLFQDCFQ